MIKPIYLLKGTFYRNKEANKSDLVEIHEEFYDAKPIIARTQVFKKFQSYVDVLLESKGLRFQSHQQAERDLNSFVNSGERHFALNIPELEIDNDFDKGLYIYLIPNPERKKKTLEGKTIYDEKHCIHYIDNKMCVLRRYVLNSLIFEFNYYGKYNFNMGDQECWTYRRGVSGKMKKVSILNTPHPDLFEIV